MMYGMPDPSFAVSYILPLAATIAMSGAVTFGFWMGQLTHRQASRR